MQRAVFTTAAFGAALLACFPDDGRPKGPINLVFDAGSDAADGEAGPAKKPLAADCTGDDECESGLCFRGGKSSFCTVKCTADTGAKVCAPPAFDGTCNNQGVCRRPG